MREMTDTEILNLIEHYKWNIQFDDNMITITNQNIAVTGSGSLREQIKVATEWLVESCNE